MCEKKSENRRSCKTGAAASLSLKKLARHWVANRQCAHRTSTLKARENSSVQTDCSIAPGPALIDALEQRLLYSADHPLGLGVFAADLHNDFAQFDDAQRVSDTLDLLHQLRLSETGTAPLLEDRMLGLNEIIVTTESDSIDATNSEMSSYANFSSGTSGDGEVSLREAIMVANADSSVGSIILPDGQYTISIDNLNPAEDGNREGDFDLEGTYLIQGESEAGTVITQTLEDRRVFEVRSGAVSFADLTLSGGGLTGTSGSAVYVHGGTSATFNNVTMTQFVTSAQGGALYIAGQANLDNVLAYQNTSSVAGGGVYVDDTGYVEISNSQFTLNQAIDSGTGGALHINGEALLNNVDIQENQAGGQGGGVYLGADAIANLIDSPIQGNTSNDDGGGIYSEGELNILGGEISGNDVNNPSLGAQTRGGGLFIASGSEVDIQNVSIIGNVADSGGAGIYNAGRLTMSSSSVSGHTVSTLGGGIFVTSTGSALLTQVGVAGNNALQGGGIYSEGDLEILNSSITDNRAQDGAGIYNNGVAQLTGVAIERNEAGQGGGIYNEGDLDITTVSIAANKAEQGGGIFSTGVLVVDDTNFNVNLIGSDDPDVSDNLLNGGGLYVGGGSADIQNSQFSANTAPSSGAGIYNEAQLTLRDSGLTGNVAGHDGGGLANLGTGTATLERVTIWGNVAQGDETSGGGGGILNGLDASLELAYSVVANNNSEWYAAGVYSLGNVAIADSRILSNATASGSTSAGLGVVTASGRTVTISNSVVANNTLDGNSADVSATANSAISGGFNLLETTSNIELLGTGYHQHRSGFRSNTFR